MNAIRNIFVAVLVWGACACASSPPQACHGVTRPINVPGFSVFTPSPTSGPLPPAAAPRASGSVRTPTPAADLNASSPSNAAAPVPLRRRDGQSLSRPDAPRP